MMDFIPRGLSGLQSDLAEIPQIKRGLVFCHSCGATRKAGVDNFRSGWPKCCGQTMSLDTPEERAAHIAAAEGGRA